MEQESHRVAALRAAGRRGVFLHDSDAGSGVSATELTVTDGGRRLNGDVGTRRFEAAKAPHGGGRGDNCREEAGTALIYLTPRRSCARKSLLDGNACPHSGQERTRFAEREFFSV